MGASGAIAAEPLTCSSGSLNQSKLAIARYWVQLWTRVDGCEC